MFLNRRRIPVIMTTGMTAIPIQNILFLAILTGLLIMRTYLNMTGPPYRRIWQMVRELNQFVNTQTWVLRGVNRGICI